MAPTWSNDSSEVEGHFFSSWDQRERETEDGVCKDVMLLALEIEKRDTSQRTWAAPELEKAREQLLPGSLEKEHSQKTRQDYMACLSYLICFLAVWLMA